MEHLDRVIVAVTFVVSGACATVTTADAPHAPELLGRVPGPMPAVAVSGDLACLVSLPGLVIADISDPTAPRTLGELAIPGRARAVAAAGNVAFVAATGGLRVVDVSEPSSPVEIAFVDLGGEALDVAVEGAFAYAVTDTRLHVVDVGTSSTPVVVGSVVTQEGNRAVAVADGFAFVVGDVYWRQGLWVVDVSIPSDPRTVGSYSVGYPADVAVSGPWVYLAETRVLRVVDTSDPAVPTEVGTLDLGAGHHLTGAAVSGSYVYLMDGYSGLLVVDVSAPSSPVVVGGVFVWDARAVSVTAGGVVVAGFGGLHVVDVSAPSAPVVVGFLPSYDANEIALSGGLAYVLGRTGMWWSGLAVVDLSTPSRPVEAAFIRWWGEGVWLPDVAAADGRAYLLLASCGWGPCFTSLGVYEVSEPSTPWELGGVQASSGVAVAVAGPLAYVAAAGEGLRVVDVSRPWEPLEVGLVDTPGSATGAAVSGTHALVADGEAGLRVVDVSTPSAPEEVGFVDTPGDATAVAVAGWYAYVADGEAGLRVVDVRTPSAPVEVGSIDTPGAAVAVAVSGGTAYVADSSAGLVVVDVSEPSSPTEVTSFATGGSAAGVAASGGLVLVGAGDAGLYVFRECTPAPPPDPRESFVAAAAYAAGAEGSYFQTDLEVGNAGTEETELVVQWLPRGEDNLHPVESDPVVLAPGQHLRFENVLAELLGLGPGSVGALRLVADTESVVGMSRTYNAPSGPSGGTFGQSLPATRATEMISGTDPRRVIFLSETPAYRANVGCVNGRSEPVTISLAAFDSQGALLGLEAMSLGPFSSDQVNRVLARWAPVDGYVDVWADRDDALYACYGSVLDNQTSDPTTVLPR